MGDVCPVIQVPMTCPTNHSVLHIHYLPTYTHTHNIFNTYYKKENESYNLITHTKRTLITKNYKQFKY
jgi:hypothetical protein